MSGGGQFVMQGGVTAQAGLVTGQLQTNQQQPGSTKVEVAIQQLQHVMRTLKSSTSSVTNSELNQQILQILKSSPQLMAAFIKHKQVGDFF